jgi:hypothetical protein
MKRHRKPRITFEDVSFPLLAQAIAANDAQAATFGDVLDRRVAAATGWDGHRVEQGEAAWTALVGVEESLEGYAYSVAQTISSAEWLWYLRRSRWLFEGHNELPTTAPYMAAVAESIGALSATPTRSPTTPPPRVMYPIDDRTAQSVLRLFAVSERLYSLHGALRWAGKGSAIRSRPEGLPECDPTPELEAMVRLWDNRVAGDNPGILAAAGLYSHTQGRAPDRAHLLRTVPVAGRGPDGSFGLAFLQVGDLPTARDATLATAIRWPAAVLDLIALLLTTAVHLGDTETEVEPGWHDAFRRTGYRVTTRAHLLSELHVAVRLLDASRLDGAIPDDAVFGSAEGILSRLTSTDVTLWPPSLGPAVRLAHADSLFVDLWGATQRLAEALARPRELAGEDANKWSRHFETTIQAAIDSSSWKPSASVAALRGRHLLIDGNAVTDVDAIGDRGSQLLLASCKCQPFSVEWDRGEYATVRNAASLVDLAVGEWATRIARFRARPRGDNYDFSGYREIIGAVVTPYVPWSPNPASFRDIAPGLRAAVSAAEFGTWLGTRTRPPTSR